MHTLLQRSRWFQGNIGCHKIQHTRPSGRTQPANRTSDIFIAVQLNSVVNHLPHYSNHICIKFYKHLVIILYQFTPLWVPIDMRISCMRINYLSPACSKVMSVCRILTVLALALKRTPQSDNVPVDYCVCTLHYIIHTWGGSTTWSQGAGVAEIPSCHRPSAGICRIQLLERNLPYP